MADLERENGLRKRLVADLSLAPARQPEGVSEGTLPRHIMPAELPLTN
jgi:hypothetical protein